MPNQDAEGCKPGQRVQAWQKGAKGAKYGCPPCALAPSALLMKQRFFATCARRLEPLLAGELRDLGAADVTEGRGGVHFAGDRATLYRANLWLRTAIRILRPVLEADVTSPDELYDAVRSLDWSQYLTPDHTLAVDCNVRDSQLTHSKYPALRVK